VHDALIDAAMGEPMAKRWKCVAGAAFGFGLVLASAGVAQAAGETFTVNTTSARRGAAIVLTSSTPCTLPSGVPGTPIVRIALVRDSTVLGRVSVTAGADGMWRASLSVGRAVAPGGARVTATCVASDQAEGALIDYDPVDVTVTSDLPTTGSHALPVAATGFGVLLFGLALAKTASRANERTTARGGRWCSSPNR
jgi:hypothetical protein